LSLPGVPNCEFNTYKFYYFMLVIYCMMCYDSIGPEHPWLVSVYAAHAPHPFASIVGQDLFQAGLVPSDTDFRIYRDYGGLPGA